MESGKWKMENGKWKMENGEWKMESGKWKVENGEWKMENGKWRVENGECLPAPAGRVESQPASESVVFFHDSDARSQLHPRPPRS